MSSLMVMSVSGSLYVLCSNVGIVAKSSSVNTSEKNALSNSAFSTSVCAMDQVVGLLPLGQCLPLLTPRISMSFQICYRDVNISCL